MLKVKEPKRLPEGKTYEILEGALRKGSVLHAFMSGGGLRVIRLEKPRHGVNTGYGEHPYVDEALRHAAEDFAAGGRPYNKVYGDGGIYDMYVTGASKPEGKLDAWIRSGNTFDVKFSDDQFEVNLRGWSDSVTPKDVVERVIRTGKSETFKDERGNEFETSAMRFPGNGEAGCSTKPISINPKYTGNRQHRLWMWRTSQVGQAATLKEAFAAAFVAKPIETEED